MADDASPDPPAPPSHDRPAHASLPHDSARLRELFDQRRAKAEALRAQGVDPYPARTDGPLVPLERARMEFEHWEKRAQGAGPEGMAPRARVAGRVTALRNLGKIAFVQIGDASDGLQLFLRQNVLTQDPATGWPLLEQLDLGDFVEAEGPLVRTRTGEISVEARTLRLLTKTLRPPPEKFHGLQDQELRYRQRYLDLQVNPDARRTFVTRSRVVSALRRFMDGRGFLEVETPVLQAEAGGAAARPFVTHFNALDEDRYLRIATELHLKRLIIGGFDKVYEIGRIFRNEGVSTLHNPEFTMLESYEAYADYHDVARMVEEAVSTIAREVLGATVIPWAGESIDLTPPWRRLTMREAVQEYAGIDFFDHNTPETLRPVLEQHRIPVPETGGWGKMLDALVSALVEPRLVQPTFLLDYPAEVSPLAKRHAGEPLLVERFEAFIAGWEVGNAYSELNDPVEQRARFEAQLRLKRGGDEEAELVDEDYLTALEHGMPPTGGLGMGIDRLVMVLTDNQSIREVILFPHLRRRE